MARLVERLLAVRAAAADAAPRVVRDTATATPVEREVGNGHVCLLRQEGDYWTLAYAGRVSRLKDARGLRLLVQILREPGREFHVYELLHVGGRGPAAPEGGPDLGNAGELLDAEARAQYRRRLSDLREELEDAEIRHDLGRAERIRAEIDTIARQLAAAVGLNGRSRQAGAASERARLSVAKGVKSAIRRIQTQHPALGRHLATHVKTGYRCTYLPDVDHPIAWTF
jgi:hypothetical protein